jgi:metal transporter CNNM
MPLYDILNEFQKGSSHMAAVVKTKGKRKPQCGSNEEKPQESLEKTIKESNFKSTLVPNQVETIVDVDKGQFGNACLTTKVNSENKQWNKKGYDDSLNVESRIPDDIEDGEVIGIITLEDVFEELLQV